MKRGIGLALMGCAFFGIGELSAAETPSITHPAIHFLSDSTVVMPEDRPKLEEDVAWLAQYPRAVVILEGHCDQTGRADYNMELGDRRAREIKSFLIERGIAADRIIMVVSFGEERPVDPRETHAALRQNRRVELVLR
jgi:peptidoglycan-associated lipoprotein